MLAARTELAQQLAELRRSGEQTQAVMTAEAQIGALMALATNVAGAPAQALAGLRTSVGASIAAAQVIVQQVRQAAQAAAGETAQLATIDAATRQQVQAIHADLLERRIFDPFLQFASPDEEEAYRRREAANRRYIEEQLALGTPAGNLNGAGGALGQMLDAHGHGAGASPDFAPRWNQLVETTRRQQGAMQAAGLSTAEFDRNLKSSVRQFLKAKGLSDAEIDAALARTADPLDAVAPYLTSERDVRGLDQFVQRAKIADSSKESALVHVTTSTATIEEQAGKAPCLDDVMAKFRAAGVVPAPATASPDHGVAQRQDNSEQRSSPG